MKRIAPVAPPAPVKSGVPRESWLIIGLTAAFLFYLCAVKVLDRDFWWHIKAGQIMLQTCSLIHIEPFAYTRAGQPYLATHEWLAQIIFYLVYHFTGATGIILMRSALVTLTAFLLLSLDWKAVWPNALLINTAKETEPIR